MAQATRRVLVACVLLVAVLTAHGPSWAWSSPTEAPAGLAAVVDPVVAVATTTDGRGSWVARASGAVVAHGTAAFLGDLSGSPLAAPIVALAASPSGHGYWMAAADGGVFSFGDARFFGSTGGMILNAPVVSMAPTASGGGYWLVASDGGVFSFGDAQFRGSVGGIVLNRPVNGMITTASGGGYWMVSDDGGVFAFGDAAFLGSTGASPPGEPVVAMAPTPSHRGYWLVTANGRVLSFGDASWLGDVFGRTLGAPVAAMASHPTAPGYVVVLADGTTSLFGASAAPVAPVPPVTTPPAPPTVPPPTGPTATPPKATIDEPPAVRSWPVAWQPASPAPSPRYEPASVVVGGRMYLFGGYRNATWQVDRTYASYTPATDTWEELGPLPAGMAETHIGIATDGRDIYLAGGFAGDVRQDVEPSQRIDAQLWRYRPSDDTWLHLGPLPQPRGAGTLAVVGRTLHYLGGNLADRVTNVGDHLTYDLDTGTWSTAAALPDPRDHLSSVVLDGRIYVLGGEHGHDARNEQQDDLHVYDPAADSWQRLASLPIATSHFEGSTVVTDGRIVVAGGQVGSFDPTADVLAYDPATDGWASWMPLPAARQGSAAHRIGSTVVVSVGAVRSDEPQTTTWIGRLS